jgi:hypothetical protein
VRGSVRLERVWSPRSWSVGECVCHTPKGCGWVEREGAPHEEGPITHLTCIIISINEYYMLTWGKGDVNFTWVLIKM